MSNCVNSTSTVLVYPSEHRYLSSITSQGVFFSTVHGPTTLSLKPKRRLSIQLMTSLGSQVSLPSSKSAPGAPARACPLVPVVLSLPVVKQIERLKLR